MRSFCSIGLILALLAFNTGPLDANKGCLIQMTINNSLMKLLNKMLQEKWAGNVHGSHCISALGMESGAIRNSQLSASSVWAGRHHVCGARRGRLNIRRHGSGAGAWCSGRHDAHQWLQVDLGKTKFVTKVATQGRQDTNEWVKSYTVKYSLDGKHWRSYSELGREKVFLGNSDRNTIVVHSFFPPIKARFVRINPRSWHGHMSMRMELYGCK